MNHAIKIFAVLTFGLVACDVSSRSSHPSSDSAVAAIADASWIFDLAGPRDMMAPPDLPPAFYGVVYAHSSTDLYQVEPTSLVVSHIAKFVFPGFGNEMTDIAIDKDGIMIGITFDDVYTVDKTNGHCTRLASLDREFNGLSFIPVPAIDGSSEMLVGIGQEGAVFEINKTTGASHIIGSFGGGLESSGDIVSVTNFGTVATVVRPGYATDWLARINPANGAATLIGDTGVTGIWGLGYWMNRLFGFTDDGKFVLIDVNTGKATLQQTSSISWWGAGVTTSAPIIQ